MPELALIEDVRLAFDPSMSEKALSNNAFFATQDDLGAVRGIIDNVESEFELETDSAFRIDQVRRPETHTVEHSGHESYKAKFSQVSTDYTLEPSVLKLNHPNVLPFDSNEGDSIEVRQHMGDWKDITSDEDTLWELLSATQGKILVDLRQISTDQGIRIRSTRDRYYVRLSYRYGATGGRTRIGGQTSLGGSGEVLSDTDTTPTTVDVGNAERLPPAPAVLRIGGSEYVSVSDVDTANDQITVDGRGLRLTSVEAHNDSEEVHYAPLMVRSSIAKRTALELTEADAYSEWFPDTDMSLDIPSKIDEWRADWKRALEVFG